MYEIHYYHIDCCYHLSARLLRPKLFMSPSFYFLKPIHAPEFFNFSSSPSFKVWFRTSSRISSNLATFFSKRVKASLVSSLLAKESMDSSTIFSKMDLISLSYYLNYVTAAFFSNYPRSFFLTSAKSFLIYSLN